MKVSLNNKSIISNGENYQKMQSYFINTIENSYSDAVNKTKFPVRDKFGKGVRRSLKIKSKHYQNTLDQKVWDKKKSTNDKLKLAGVQFFSRIDYFKLFETGGTLRGSFFIPNPNIVKGIKGANMRVKSELIDARIQQLKKYPGVVQKLRSGNKLWLVRTEKKNNNLLRYVRSSYKKKNGKVAENGTLLPVGIIASNLKYKVKFPFSSFIKKTTQPIIVTIFNSNIRKNLKEKFI